MQGADVPLQPAAPVQQLALDGLDLVRVHRHQVDGHCAEQALPGLLAPAGVGRDVEHCLPEPERVQAGDERVRRPPVPGDVQHGASRGGRVGHDGGQRPGDIAPRRCVHEQVVSGRHDVEHVGLDRVQVADAALLVRRPVAAEHRRERVTQRRDRALVAGQSSEHLVVGHRLSQRVEVIEDALLGVHERADQEPLVEGEVVKRGRAQRTQAVKCGARVEAGGAERAPGQPRGVQRRTPGAQRRGEHGVDLQRGLEREVGVAVPPPGLDAHGSQQDRGTQGPRPGRTVAARPPVAVPDDDGVTAAVLVGVSAGASVVGLDAVVRLDVARVRPLVRLGPCRDPDRQEGGGEPVALRVVVGAIRHGAHPALGRGQGGALPHQIRQPGGTAREELRDPRGVRRREVEEGVPQPVDVRERRIARIGIQRRAPAAPGAINQLRRRRGRRGRSRARRGLPSVGSGLGGWRARTSIHTWNANGALDGRHGAAPLPSNGARPRGLFPPSDGRRALRGKGHPSPDVEQCAPRRGQAVRTVKA